MDLIEKATQIAVKAHHGQTRKTDATPYIVHPVAVALLLARHGFDDAVIAAAFVHDVVEDTEITLDEIQNELGKEVASLIAPLTHDSSLSWEDKKLGYIEMVRIANERVKAIATADKISNAQSLLEAYEINGSEIWKYFNARRDKKIWFERSMLSMLQETWKHPLVDEYASLVRKVEILV